MEKIKTIDVIIPIFNEEKTLKDIVERVENLDLFGLKKKIILIDDGSSDNSRKILKEYETRHKVIYHDTNQGKGAAVYTGFKNATSDIVVIQDADLEYDPIDYKKVIEPILNNEAKVVYGSRFLNENHEKSFLFLSLMANKFLTFLTNFLFGSKITDMETCYKAFSRDIIKNIQIKSKRFDFEPEITAKVVKQGVKIKEVPISYNGRNWQEGKKITYKDGIIAVFTLIKYRFFN